MYGNKSELAVLAVICLPAFARPFYEVTVTRPSPAAERNVMPDTQAAASLAAALQDREGSRVGDPYRNQSHVQFIRAALDDARELKQHLDHLGCIAQLSSTRREPIVHFVTLYSVNDQRRLLDQVGELLDPARRGELDRLVRARSPIPEWVLNGMRVHSRAGRTHQEIANRLNTAGVIDGMRCIEWTAKKVRDALRPTHHVAQRVEEAA